jgi:predicted PurR-regulated permease PerM
LISTQWPWDLELQIPHILLIIIFWLLWVFVFPFTSPFIKKLRSKIIEYSEKLNRFESYSVLKNKLESLEKTHLNLVEESIKNDEIIKKISSIINNAGNSGYI